MTAQNPLLNNKTTSPVFSDENLSTAISFPQLITYTIKDFLKWWYIQMPIWHMMTLRRLSTIIDDKFSISLLIKTFFIPWHRDHTPVGYLIGIVMRILYIPIALFIYLITTLTYILFILFWISIPILTLVFLIISPFTTN